MDWKKTLGELAPTIGAAFGPLGIAGGIAVRQLLGVSADTNDEQLDTYLQTPEGALKAKQADYDYKIRMKELDVASDSLDIDNTKSARDRDTAIQNKIGTNKRADNLAYMAVFTFLLLVISLVFFKLPEGVNRDVCFMMLGVLAGIAKDIYQFEFGSSRGSKEKDSRIQL